MTVKEVVLKNHKVSFVKINNSDYRKFEGTYEDFVKTYSGTDVWNEHVACYALSKGKNWLELWL